VKKILMLLVFIPVLNTAVNALTYTDMAGDTLGAWKAEAEYKEKYFQYNTLYEGPVETPGIMLRGIDEDFTLRLGLPGGYAISLGANYIFQNLEGLYDYNNVQTITLLGIKQFDPGPGILLGIRFPLNVKMADDPVLINNNDRYNLLSGFVVKNSWGFLKYSAQAVYELPIGQFSTYPPERFKTDYQGSADLSASLGFNLYNDPSKQVIDILAEAEYSLVQRDSGNSQKLSLIPQAVMRFYDDFNLILGAEILAGADNIYLNKKDIVWYVVKVNYVLNSDKRASAVTATAQSGFAPGAFLPVGTTASAVAVTTTAAGTSLLQGIPVLTPTPAVK
jgi:hypothetical protein